MAQATWEKRTNAGSVPVSKGVGGRLKFIVGGLLILGAVAYLIVSGTLTGTQYFITVDDALHNAAYAGQTVRLSGAVIGHSIQYNSEKLTIDFTIVNIPTQFDDLATALHNAVNDPNSTQLHVHIENQVKPDLLQHEAQAIVTGRLGDDGVFYATELLLKCPSRFIEGGPQQANVQPEA